jgi:WD40 repeat protein
MDAVPARSLAFSPSGRWTATSSSDGRIRVFSSDGIGEAVTVGAVPSGLDGRAFFTDDGSRVVGLSSGVLRAWPLDPDLLIRSLRELVRDCLTEAERVLYLSEDPDEASAGERACRRRY